MTDFTANKKGLRLMFMAVAGCLVIAFIFSMAPAGVTSLRANNSQSSLMPSGALDLYAPTAHPVSYDVTTPPGVGCEAIVSGLQHELIFSYSKILKGLRFVNIWGYLQYTENKGDAAIWTAQQILLSMLGIQTMEACRYAAHIPGAASVPGGQMCDMGKFRKSLEQRKPHAGIIMAGGGNFNDYFWNDQPQRMEMVKQFHDFPIRAFPQSVYMRKPDRIALTKQAFVPHQDLQLGARDQPSFDWLNETFGPSEENRGIATGVTTTLTPDIAFMFGNRPDFRLHTPKEYDILIMRRNDVEISALQEDAMPDGDSGTIQLGAHSVTWRKDDWNNMPTPGLKGHERSSPNPIQHLKAAEGFRILGRAEFVITDRLHGHILSTVIGLPHVLLDSKLGKNLAFHNTWTINCNCVRVATEWDEAIAYATMFFDKAYRDGTWKPANERQ